MRRLRQSRRAPRLIRLHLPPRALVQVIAHFNALALHALLFGKQPLLRLASLGGGGFRHPGIFHATTHGFLRHLCIHQRLLSCQRCLFRLTLQHLAIAGPAA